MRAQRVQRHNYRIPLLDRFWLQVKLTEEDVRYIITNYIPRSPTNGQRLLAEEFGVTVTTICDIINRKLWKHVV